NQAHGNLPRAMGRRSYAPALSRSHIFSSRGGRHMAVHPRYQLAISSSPRMSVDFDSDTRRRRGFFLASGCPLLPLVPLIARKTRQKRSIPRSALRKKRPAASTASIANVRASTADARLALGTSSRSFRSSPFKGLPFAATILAHHFPGCCSNAVISSPLYCIARPRCVFLAGRKGEQRLAANLKKATLIPP